jgi:hypothetical protein
MLAILVVLLAAECGWLEYSRRRAEDLLPSITSRETTGDGREVIELLSPRYDLDEVVMSMEGPRSNHPLIPVSTEGDPDRTIWVTGVRADVVDYATCREISREFFCHSNLTLSEQDLDPEDHNLLFETPTHLNWRLFTLIPGRMEIQLPEGFGVPVKGSTKLDYYTMALNQNPGFPARSIRLRSHVTLEREKPLKPLFQRTLYVYQRHVEDAQSFDPAISVLAGHAQGAHQGELCVQSCTEELLSRFPSLFQSVKKGGSPREYHPGENCCVMNASAGGVVEQFGEQHTVHWMVPPGEHRFRTEVTEQLRLPFETAAHYVTGHLHPMGTSLRLVDLEIGETVFEITAKCLEDRLGVVEMSEITSVEGIGLHRDRRYELIADYNNTSDKLIDVMGIMYLYLLDQPAETEGVARVADRRPLRQPEE